MKKEYCAAETAVEIAKVLLSSVEFRGTPNADTANAIADFITTLADRLEPMYERIEG